MPYFSSPIDGARLYYADYRPQPAVSVANAPAFLPTTIASETQKHDTPKDMTIVFLHGWPMSHEMFTHLMLPLSQNYHIRCIASDRRGFGKSEWSGTSGPYAGEEVTYTTLAYDSVAFIGDARIEGPFIFVGASMGAGESILTYNLLPRALQEKCKGFVFLGPSAPFPLKTDDNPTAPPRELWDAILQGLRDDRVGFVREGLKGVFGTSFDIGVEVSPTIMERFEWIVAQADSLAIERCPMIITGKDFTEEIKKIEKRVLVVHGDHDQSMPASCSADLIGDLVPDKRAEVKIYQNASHGMYLTHAGQLMEDLLAFLASVAK